MNRPILNPVSGDGASGAGMGHSAMKEDLKTIVIAVTGTGISVSLAKLLPIVSLIAGILTIIYTACKLFDWTEARIEKWKARRQ